MSPTRLTSSTTIGAETFQTREKSVTLRNYWLSIWDAPTVRTARRKFKCGILLASSCSPFQSNSRAWSPHNADHRYRFNNHINVPNGIGRAWCRIMSAQADRTAIRLRSWGFDGRNRGGLLGHSRGQFKHYRRVGGEPEAARP